VHKVLEQAHFNIYLTKLPTK